MTATAVDEETPLLQVGAPKRTPLDFGQLSIVLFLQLAEPLTNQVIYPFAPQVRVTRTCRHIRSDEVLTPCAPMV